MNHDAYNPIYLEQAKNENEETQKIINGYGLDSEKYTKYLEWFYKFTNPQNLYSLIKQDKNGLMSFPATGFKT